MPTPEVSVIIPTCNRESMLLRAIKSVKDQTYQNYELIIVDDASTDNTQKSVTQIQDQNTTYIRFETNSGTSSKPRNAGLEIARGKYIAFLDDDDEWLPTLLEKLTDKIKTVDERVGVIYCGLIYVDSQGDVLKTVHPMLRGTLWPLMLVNTIGTLSSSLIKRECFNKVGLFDVEGVGAHSDMWIRLAKHYDYDYIPEALARYHLHENQMTYSGHEILRKEARLKKYANDYIKYPREFQAVKSNIGLSYLLKGDRYQGLKYLPDMLRENRYLMFYLALALLFISPRLWRQVVNLKQLLTSKALWKKK